MYRLTIVAFLTTLMVVACSKQEPAEILTHAPTYATLADAQKAVGTSGKHIVLDFYTDW